MINQNELQQRTFPTAMDGSLFLTARTAKVVDGSTEYNYIGLAHPGSNESGAVWMIQRVMIQADGSTATLFANGAALFDQVWSDHASLSYS